MLKVALLCVCIQLSNSFFTRFPPIGQRRILLVVQEAAVVQLEDPTAHYVSPPLHSDRGVKYVNEHTADISKLPLIPESLNSENRT